MPNVIVPANATALPSFLTETGFDKSAIMTEAWVLARRRAARDRTTVCKQFSEALSAIWHNARVEAQRAGRAKPVKVSPIRQARADLLAANCIDSWPAAQRAIATAQARLTALQRAVH